MIQNYLFLIFLVGLTAIHAQKIDTTQAKHIHALELQVDSLRAIIRSMDKEIQLVKQNTVEGANNVDELIAMLNDDDVETVSSDSRSRRKRVDALLKAITQRPGQLRLNGGATATLQHWSQDDSRQTAGVGSFDIYAHTAFGPNTLLFFDLEAIGGNGPDEYVPTMAGLNGDAGSTQDEDGVDRLTVLEAWAEFTLLDKIITVTAGKIDLTNYFDNNASANDETMQFISGSFVNSAAFAVPENSPGVRLRSTLLDRIHFQIGLSASSNSRNDLFNEFYRISGLGFTLWPGSDFESSFRIYGYQHPLADNSTGWGVSVDNVAYGAYNFFGRYGRNSAELSEYWGIESAWSAGTRFVKQVAGQIAALGLAYGENKSNRNELNDERTMEIYVRRQLNKWTHFSPHVQVVWNAGGGTERATFIGARTHFNF